MDIEFQRRIDRYIGVPCCWSFSLLSRLRRPPEDFLPGRILIILLSEMGSLVLAQPMFRRLEQLWPDASLYALIFRQNKDVLDVLDVFPQDNILTLRNDSFGAFVADSARVVHQMRAFEIDTVLDCELFSRVSSIFSFLSGAAVRAGFHPHTQEGLYRGSFINRPVLYNPHQHIARQFITLAEAVACGGSPRAKRLTGEDDLHIDPLAVTPEEVSSMAGRIQRDFAHVAGKRLVLIHPGGGALPIRAWPAEGFSDVALALTRRGYAVGITGMERDRHLALRIQSHCASPLCVDLTGYTATVRELMLLFHVASLLIANDGGPGHFASMTPIPTILLYGPETPALYGPLDDKATSFFANLSCSPCLTAYNHRKSPCDGDNLCLKLIAPETVLNRSIAILEGDVG